MSISRIAKAMGNIDDDLISDAIEYKQTKKKSTWIKWGAMAACLCLVVGLAIPVLKNTVFEQDYHSGLSNVENPVYDVVEYAVPASYANAELYISTTSGLDEYDAYMAEHYGSKFLGKGLRVFTFVEGTTTEDFNVWYFDYDGTSISRIYYVTKSNDKFLVSWSDSGEFGKGIEALASKTSAGTPMYLVQDDEVIYTVIDKTAYYLPGMTTAKPSVSQMPEIKTDGLEIVSISLP